MISIPGTTTSLTPDDRPAIGVYGSESSGKTRFAATMPGPIGLIALDKKSKRTFEKIAGDLKTQVIVNSKPLMTDQEAIKVALTSGDNARGLAEIKQTYTSIVERVFDLAMKYAEHPDIQSVVVDTNSQLFEFILFSHFGRRNQIQPTSRGAANQDQIDFVNALRSKNLVLIHRSKEIWKSTGGVDRDGKPIKEPSGKFEHDGFKNIGGFLTANLEFTSKRTKTSDFDEKFKARVVTCQANVLMEGQDLTDYGISGESITWDNIMPILGILE